MLLAFAITSRLAKILICPLKQSELQDKENFNNRFELLLDDVTTCIEDDLSRDAIIWLREVSISLSIIVYPPHLIFALIISKVPTEP